MGQAVQSLLGGLALEKSIVKGVRRGELVVVIEFLPQIERWGLICFEDEGLSFPPMNQGCGLD